MGCYRVGSRISLRFRIWGLGMSFQDLGCGVYELGLEL